MCKNWRVIMMKIVAFTGAGISKQSNIPTFMERPDVREKLFRNFKKILYLICNYLHKYYIQSILKYMEIFILPRNYHD